MSRSLCFAAAALAALSGAGALATPPGGSLSVSFIDPQSYTDAAYSHPYASEKDLAAVESDITRHLTRLAERKLAPGDSLKIEVLDIDLAGRFEPFRFNGQEIRVVRDITWPRMTLRYTLSHDDRILASGEERLADMNFMMSVNMYSSSDPLRYEKPMLDDWFDRRIVRH